MEQKFYNIELDDNNDNNNNNNYNDKMKILHSDRVDSYRKVQIEINNMRKIKSYNAMLRNLYILSSMFIILSLMSIILCFSFPINFTFVKTKIKLEAIKTNITNYNLYNIYILNKTSNVIITNNTMNHKFLSTYIINELNTKCNIDLGYDYIDQVKLEKNIYKYNQNEYILFQKNDFHCSIDKNNIKTYNKGFFISLCYFLSLLSIYILIVIANYLFYKCNYYKM
jgi:hypothetical protein